MLSSSFQHVLDVSLLYSARRRIDGAAASLGSAEALGFLTLSCRTLMTAFAISSILDAKVSTFSLAKSNGLMLVWLWRQSEFAWAVVLNSVVYIYIHMGRCAEFSFFFHKKAFGDWFSQVNTHLHLPNWLFCSAYKFDCSLDIYHDNSDLPVKQKLIPIKFLCDSFETLVPNRSSVSVVQVTKTRKHVKM